jgi:hypothetical protein
VIAIDAFVGNPLALPTLSTSTVADPVPPAAADLTRVESETAAVLQNGTWTNFTVPGASGGGYLYSSGDTSDTLTLEFVGTQVDIIFTQHSMPPSFVIDIDGQVVGSVAVSDPVGIFGWRTSITDLSFSQHTLRVVPVSGIVTIDAFDVGLSITDTKSMLDDRQGERFLSSLANSAHYEYPNQCGNQKSVHSCFFPQATFRSHGAGPVW